MEIGWTEGVVEHIQDFKALVVKVRPKLEELFGLVRLDCGDLYVL